MSQRNIGKTLGAKWKLLFAKQDWQKREPRDQRLMNLYSSGLLIISLAILQNFMSSRQLDAYATWAVIACAVAIPTLAGALLENVFRGPNKWSTVLLAIPGMLSSFIAITLAFFHTLLAAGGIFLLASFVTAIVFLRGESKDDKEYEKAP